MSDIEANKRLVLQHFDEFVNQQDLDAILRNMADDFLDHDGPGGRPTDRAGDRAMMAEMFESVADLRVDVADIVAEGDKVMVRNVWTGTSAKTGGRIEFRGFVLWRLRDGKIVERWATVTPPTVMASPRPADREGQTDES